jgi:phenylacetate-CoA ligase
VSATSYRGIRRIRFELFFVFMWTHAWMIRGAKTRDAYMQLKKSEFITREEMQKIQSERLRQIVKHFYETSSFYRTRFEALGLGPESIKSILDIEKLPFISKDDIRENLETGLVSSRIDRKKMLRINTSGSTGQPFTIYADRNQLEVRFASTLRSLEWTGWRFGDAQARLWHQTLGMSRSQIIRERVDAWFMKRLFIPAFELSPKNIEDFVSKIRAHNPVLIDGYAESLNFLAMYLSSGKTAGFSPMAIMSSAQALPTQTREIIEKGFGTKVFDKYGSREFSGIAYECCEHANHHVIDECYIVELLVEGRPALPGEVGEIVITDLFNLATPMIRYRIGDLATAVDNEVPCPCGRPHSQIGQIEGRTQAIVHCSDGTWLPGTFFAHFFKDFEKIIRFFQIEQHDKGQFTLKIVKNDGFVQSELDELILKLRKYVGDTTVKIEFVDEIPLVRTGKRSPVVSTVKEDFQSFTPTTSSSRTK